MSIAEIIIESVKGQGFSTTETFTNLAGQPAVSDQVSGYVAHLVVEDEEANSVKVVVTTKNGVILGEATFSHVKPHVVATAILSMLDD